MSTERKVLSFDGTAARKRAVGDRGTQPSVEPRLADAVARVKADAEHDPETYARDAEVPFGGE